MKRLYAYTYWIGFFGIFFISCEDKQETKDKIVWEKPIMQSFNSLGLMSEEAKVSKRISGPQMDRYQNGNMTYPKGVLVQFYDSLGTLTQTLKADSAYYIKKTDLLAAKGNVVLNEYIEKTILNTEMLFWNRKTKKIYSDAKVKVQSDQQIISGTGLEADQSFKKWKIKKVSGIIPVPEQEENTKNDK